MASLKGSILSGNSKLPPYNFTNLEPSISRGDSTNPESGSRAAAADIWLKRSRRGSKSFKVAGIAKDSFTCFCCTAFQGVGIKIGAVSNKSACSLVASYSETSCKGRNRKKGSLCAESEFLIPGRPAKKKSRVCSATNPAKRSCTTSGQDCHRTIHSRKLCRKRFINQGVRKL